MLGLVIGGVLIGWPVKNEIVRWQEETAARNRLATAEAMFQERCKKSGEFIHKTAENVEGVFLLKVRPKETNFGDQYKLDDPYGRDFAGDGYIENFFWGRDKQDALDNTKVGGYHYVDAIDPKDDKRYRYIGRLDEPWKTNPNALEGHRKFVLDKTPAPDPVPRYGVTYDDISTREERDYWIAGSSLKVIDLQTNEVMAERIGYMMDRGQGNTGSFSSPWLRAQGNACPPNPYSRQTRNFVEKVLHLPLEK